MVGRSGRSYSSFRIPEKWGEQERSFIRQLQDILDRIYHGDYIVADRSKLAKQMLNHAYPIGSIYFNESDDADPGALFGGTWETITSSIGYAWKRTE